MTLSLTVPTRAKSLGEALEMVCTIVAANYAHKSRTYPSDRSRDCVFKGKQADALWVNVTWAEKGTIEVALRYEVSSLRAEFWLWLLMFGLFVPGWHSYLKSDGSWPPSAFDIGILVAYETFGVILLIIQYRSDRKRESRGMEYFRQLLQEELGPSHPRQGAT